MHGRLGDDDQVGRAIPIEIGERPERRRAQGRTAPQQSAVLAPRDGAAPFDDDDIFAVVKIDVERQRRHRCATQKSPPPHHGLCELILGRRVTRAVQIVARMRPKTVQRRRLGLQSQK